MKNSCFASTNTYEQKPVQVFAATNIRPFKIELVRMKFLVLTAIICALAFFPAQSQENQPTPVLQPDSAIVLFQKILKKNKNSAYANHGIATAYLVKGNYAGAIKYSRQALKLNSEYRAGAFAIWGTALERRGNIKESIEVFSDALKEFPNNTALLYGYAFSSYKYRSFELAKNALEKTIQPNELNPDIYYLYGCVLFESSNEPSCVHSFAYGLMLDFDSERKLKALSFLELYLQKKMDQINIPYFDARLAITDVTDILKNYNSQNKKDIGLKTNEFEKLLKLLPGQINTVVPAEPAQLKTFYTNLINNGLTQVYVYYLLRNSNNQEVETWMKNNSSQLSELANFLEKNL